jgi:hypothetical protein
MSSFNALILVIFTIPGIYSNCINDGISRLRRDHAFRYIFFQKDTTPIINAALLKNQLQSFLQWRISSADYLSPA